VAPRWGREALAPWKALDRFLGDGCEQVDEVSVGMAEQDWAVAPRHRGWFLDPVLDEVLQARVFGVDVVDAEFDDRSVVVGGACRPGGEQSD
jgi:hypothetical protein